MSFDPNKITTYFKGILPPNIEELKSQNKNFIDSSFPPNEQSLLAKNASGQFLDKETGAECSNEILSCYPRGAHQWKRPKDIRRGDWRVFTDKIEFNDVKQGLLGDCYFHSAIAALTEYPKLILEKFRTTAYNDVGYYEMVFFIDGEWQIVFVDDYFPVNGNNFVFGKPNDNELWAVLLEKAWAKINGGYTNIVGGFVQEVLLALTGFPSEHIQNNSDKQMVIYNKIEKSNDEGAVMGCGSFSDGSGKDTFRNKGNIVYSHAYTLIDAKSKKDNDIYLLKIRNPWGKTEWNGDWSDNSSKWNEAPDYKSYFGMQRKEDGIFFMDIDDYVQNYEDTSICHILYGAKIRSYSIDYEDYLKFPAIFEIQMQEKGLIFFSSIVRDRRFNRTVPNNEFRPFSLLVFKYDENYNATKFYGAKSSLYPLTESLELEPGNYCVITFVPYEYLQNIGPEFRYSFQVGSKAKYLSRFAGKDNNFEVTESMIISYYKNAHSFEMQTTKNYILAFFQEIHNATYISPVILYNKIGFNVHFDVDFSQVRGYKILGRFAGKTIVPVDLANGEVGVILFALADRTAALGFSASLRNSSRGAKTNQFNLVPSSFLDPKKIHEDAVGPDGRKVKTKNYTFITKETAEEIPDLNQYLKKDEEKKKGIENKYNEYETLRKDYPTEFKIMDRFVKDLPETKNYRWMKIKNNSGIYAGQIADDNSVTGRGLFIYPNGQRYIGRWKNGQMDGYGILFAPEGRLIYQGDFDKGTITGNGIYYHSRKQYYIGSFVKNKMHGYGLYHYENGYEWEGNFKNHLKDGVGLMKYPGGKLSIYVFDEGKKVKEIELDSAESMFLKSESQKVRNVQDRYVLGAGSLEDLTNTRNEFLDSLEQIYRMKESGTKVQIEGIDTFRRANETALRTGKGGEKEHSIADSQNTTVEGEEELKKKAENAKDLQKKVIFMFQQLKDLNPIINPKNLALTERGNTKLIKYKDNDGDENGLGAYFDGTNYFIGDFERSIPYGYIRKFNDDKNPVMEGKMINSFIFENGYAKKYFPNGDKYEGEIVSEKMNGRGVYTFANGDVYKGTFKNDTFDGKGQLLVKKGLDKYAVEYENGKEINRTSIPFQKIYKPTTKELPELIPQVIQNKLFELYNRLPPSLSYYDDSEIGLAKIEGSEYFFGEVTKSNFVPNGKGIVSFCGPDGQHFFVGTFVDGCRNGKGFYVGKDLTIEYEGNFVDDKFDGFGVLKKENFPYSGNFKSNMPHTYGDIDFGSNEVKAVGFFQKGEQVAMIKILPEEGKYQVLEFSDGNLKKSDTIVDTNSPDMERKYYTMQKLLESRYKKYIDLYLALPSSTQNIKYFPNKKHFIDGLYIGELNAFEQREGRGALINRINGDYYIGYFKNNKKNGEGKIYDKNDKLIFEGEFVNDEQIGKGKYYTSNGTIEGTFDECGNGIGSITANGGGKKSKNKKRNNVQFIGLTPIN